MNSSANASKPKTKWSIPTKYAGVEFRSKLEADWAMFFDWIGIRWAYEVEGYDLNGLRYLPDFWLPDAKTIVEVKGVLDDVDERKIFSLADVAADRGIVVVVAEAPVGQRYALVHPHPQDLEPYGAQWTGLDYETVLVRCARCGHWYFRYDMGSWECSGCGYYDGDQTYSEIFDGNPTGMLGYGEKKLRDWVKLQSTRFS